MGCQVFSCGDVIFAQGAHGDKFYVVLKGSVNVTVRPPNSSRPILSSRLLTPTLARLLLTPTLARLLRHYPRFHPCLLRSLSACSEKTIWSVSNAMGRHLSFLSTLHGERRDILCFGPTSALVVSAECGKMNGGSTGSQKRWAWRRRVLWVSSRRFWLWRARTRL